MERMAAKKSWKKLSEVRDPDQPVKDPAHEDVPVDPSADPFQDHAPYLRTSTPARINPISPRVRVCPVTASISGVSGGSPGALTQNVLKSVLSGGTVGAST